MAVHYTTLFGWNILANFLLDDGTLLFGDNFTLGLGSSCAFFLQNWFTLILIPGAALLINHINNTTVSEFKVGDRTFHHHISQRIMMYRHQIKKVLVTLNY